MSGVLLSKDLALRVKTLVEEMGIMPVKTTNKSIGSGFAGFVTPIELTEDWNNDDDKGWKSKMKRLWFRPDSGDYRVDDSDNSETEIYYPLTSEQPQGSAGTRAFAVFRGRWEVIAFNASGEGTGNKKELFPAVVYRTADSIYIVCPGGHDGDRSIKTVHVIDVTNKSVSTNKFGKLPMAMSNFGAAIADNGYGTPVLVCAPGEVESGTKYPVQRYDFIGEEWSKSDTNQSLVGCPAYVKDGKVIVAGGQSSYYVSNPVKTAQSSVTQFYGHHVTPFWEIDPASGALKTRSPLRLITSGTTEQPESAVVNQQKKFMKQNFSGIHYEHTENGRPVEFVAVGGTELLGYQGNAVVSYAMDSLGALLTCEYNTTGVYDNCEVFPDTPVPLGECCCVKVDNRIICIGGRYRIGNDVMAADENGNTAKDENDKPIILYKKGEYAPHKNVWTLDPIEKKWNYNAFPETPTPRWNAALSEPITINETYLNGNTKTVKKIFLIGGRIDNRYAEKVEVKNEKGDVIKIYHKLVTKKGFTDSIEVLNITDKSWETDFPSLGNKKALQRS
jgi:hypothetical protein